jgi:hypothetical protein
MTVEVWTLGKILGETWGRPLTREWLINVNLADRLNPTLLWVFGVTE